VGYAGDETRGIPLRVTRERARRTDRCGEETFPPSDQALEFMPGFAVGKINDDPDENPERKRQKSRQGIARSSERAALVLVAVR